MSVFKYLRTRTAPADDTDNTEGAPDSKRSQPSPLWEWEGDGGKWSKYAPEHSQQLTDALLAGKKDLTIQVAPNVRTKIRFSTMTQMNASTGWQRNIRCCQAGGPAVWEWEEDGLGLWRAHTPAISRLLEACHLCGVDSTLIESGSKRLTVDLKALKQTDPGDSSERSVRRVDGALLSNGGIRLMAHVVIIEASLPPSLLFPSPFLFPLPLSHFLFFRVPTSPFPPFLPSFFTPPPLSHLPFPPLSLLPFPSSPFSLPLSLLPFPSPLPLFPFPSSLSLLPFLFSLLPFPFSPFLPPLSLLPFPSHFSLPSGLWLPLRKCGSGKMKRVCGQNTLQTSADSWRVPRPLAPPPSPSQLQVVATRFTPAPWNRLMMQPGWCAK